MTSACLRAMADVFSGGSSDSRRPHGRRGTASASLLSLALAITAISATSALAPASASANQAPIAAYALNAPYGQIAYDSGERHDGGISKPEWVAGKYGQALHFDGKESCISVPDSVELQLTEAFTVEAWVNSDRLQGYVPIFYKEAQGFYSYSLYLGVLETGHVEGFVNDEEPGWSEVISPARLPEQEWTHIAFSSDGTYLRLYINGKLVSTASASGIGESDGPLYIGCAPGSEQYFEGVIDEARIYNRR